MKTFKTVLFPGARQVGKLTLLRHRFPEYKYVSLDDPFLEERASQKRKHVYDVEPPSDDHR